MTAATVVGAVAAAIGATAAAVRWLRVAQREHYLAGSVTRFGVRWWFGFGPNRILALAAALGVVLSPITPLAAVGAGAALAVGPFHLSLLGRSPGRVAWTRRLRTLAAILIGLVAVIVGLGALTGQPVTAAAAAALIMPALVDLACALAAPIEDRLAERFVTAAIHRLAEVSPTIVGITGSFGKTSTKLFTAHLCGGSFRTVATPASFNNRAGLSRAINEHVGPGTEVFIAEMGTYGPGEIRDLVRWCPPSVAAITAIGPVHLERFRTEDAVVVAKSEIFDAAKVAVLNVDDARLAAVADAQRALGLRVWRCSTRDLSADVCVRRDGERLVVSRLGERVTDMGGGTAHASNVAVAVALALEVGTPLNAVAERLADLPQVANRQAVSTLSTGARVIDDTFNSNPTGCAAALEALARLASADGRRVVVTPGMVELGPRQEAENVTFGAALASAATHVVVVGWTNRRALLEGLGRGPEVILVDRREQAVAWVRANTGANDVVLYENDLPDHYP